MLNYSPLSFGHDAEYYASLMGSSGFPNNNPVVSPFTFMGSFSSASGANREFYMDLNRSAGLGSLTGKSLFHGNLFLKMYCTAFVAGGVATTSLYQYTPAGLNQNWIVESRTIAAVETPDLNRNVILPSCLFNYIVVSNSSGGADFTYTVGVHFVGVKISY